MKKHLATVSRRVWRKMIEIGHDFDLNKDGIYDSRLGAVNIWVSPDDKPEDWEFRITKGALKYPRAYLATIYGEARETDYNIFDLYLTITNYERRDKAKILFNQNLISYEEYRKECKIAENGTAEEWKWAETKAKWLLDLAKKEQVFKTVLKCPFCGNTNFKLFNDLISCIVSHGIRVDSVILGQGILTEKGLLTEADYTSTIREAENV